ncbi:MAG TPA: nitrous oxide reductase family maturation protein NosD [Gemmatimonadales bacterium]|nr:nitrous oxide reductase family maturation protein NosD [Gemmatimonadales bacterium]
MTVCSRAPALLLTLLSLGPLSSAPPEASRIVRGTSFTATTVESKTRSDILKVRSSSVTDPVRASLKPRVPGSEIVVDPAGPIRTLGAALLMARPHGRIRVRPGTYREARILVQQPVTIEGEGWPRFIGADHEVITVTADSVTIRGLIISDVAATAAEDRAGIRFSGVRGCTVENTQLLGTFFGIYLAQSSGCRIAGNTIRGRGTVQGLSGNAIHAWNSSDLTIEHNDLAGHRDGIYLEFTSGSRIRDNRSTGHLRYGLHFMFSDRCDYSNNLFAHNGAGVAVMFSKTVTMRRNRFEHNWGSASYGLLLKELRDSRIEDNQFTENTVGLWTEGTSRVLVSKNRFVANGWAIRVLGDATDNEFRENHFLANTFDVGTAPGRNSNVFEANYWDHYRGYDLNHDGYGDVPFQPVRLFSVMIQQHEPALILLHSFFIELLDFAERVIPAFTDETLMDRRPLMRRGA